MNTADFERKLQQQPVRQIPAGWRAEILSAAKHGARKTDAVNSPELLAGWRLLLARFPVAWGTVAAIWLVMVGVNMLMSGPATAGIAASSAPAQADAMTVWNLQRPDSKLLASLLAESPGNPPAPVSPVALPRPRSDRRQDEGLGEIHLDNPIETFV